MTVVSVRGHAHEMDLRPGGLEVISAGNESFLVANSTGGSEFGRQCRGATVCTFEKNEKW